MLVELLVASLGADGNRGGDAFDFSCSSVHFTSIPVADASIGVVESIPEKAPMVIIGCGVRGMEHALGQPLAGCGEIHIGFQFDPAFAGASEFCNQSFMDTLLVVRAYSFCLRETSDIRGRLILLFFAVGLALHLRRLRSGRLRFRIAAKKEDGTDPDPNAGNGGNQHICFVLHYDLCFRFSLNPFSTRLAGSVQSLAGGAHGG